MDAYVGQIRLFAGNYVPEGWALCDGSSLPINGNEALYTLIGVTYGGDAQTKFNLPDLRGRVPVHVGLSPKTVTNYTLGQTVGVDTVALVEAHLPPHNHAVNASADPAATTSPANALLGTFANKFYEPATAAGFTLLPMNSVAVGPEGGATSHDNSMPTVALNYIICLYGLFPAFQ